VNGFCGGGTNKKEQVKSLTLSPTGRGKRQPRAWATAALLTWFG
jgi:hypothetical protein